MSYLSISLKFNTWKTKEPQNESQTKQNKKKRQRYEIRDGWMDKSSFSYQVIDNLLWPHLPASMDGHLYKVGS